MTQASSQAHAFYREVAEKRMVWGIRDTDGFPTFTTREGKAMPFWSSRSRVERVVATVPAYAGFSPVEINWADFKSAWVPGMEKDGLLAGVNWSGKRALGYDLKPSELEANVEAVIARQNKA